MSIFVHENPAKHNLFFNDVAPWSAPGFTFRIPNLLGVKTVVSVMEKCIDCQGHAGTYTFSDGELGEFTAHELGHALRFQLGSDPEHTSLNYIDYQRNDLLNLDYSVVGNTQAPSTQRPRYSPTNDGSAPFDKISGLYNSSLPAEPFCVNGTFNSVHGNPPSSVLNSEILQNSSNRLTPIELFAQTFAFKTAPNIPAYLDIALDGIFENSANGGSKPWFACTLARAEQLSLTTGTIAGACLNQVPAWYENLLPASVK